MQGRLYEYRGLLASTWDLLRGDTSKWSDRPFYRRAIERYGEPALDVGCGTGRLLLDYLAAGIDVEGVDNSPEMLALCREKARALGLRPTLHEQRMQALDLPRRYRTIIVPSSSFQLLADPADASEAMRRFFAHLDPGGALVMPFMIPENTATTNWKVSAEAVRPEDGARVRRSSRSTYDVVTQVQHEWDRFEVLRDSTVVTSEEPLRSDVRWYTQEQAVALYLAVGFRQIRIVRGFTEEPATGTSTIFSVFGTRPA